MLSENYLPYTYLIGWTRYNLWYYGSETKSKKRKANPENLWRNYFTSSKSVREVRSTLGEPDIIQVRKTFTCPHACLAWEQEVLYRMKVVSDSKWLNQAIYGKKQYALNSEMTEKAVRTRRMRYSAWHSDDTKKKISQAKTGVQMNLSELEKDRRSIHFTERNHNDKDFIEKNRQGRKRRWAKPEEREAQAKRMSQSISRPDVQARMNEQKRSPEAVQMRREISGKNWGKVESSMREGLQKYLSDPLNRQKNRQKIIERHQKNRGWNTLLVDNKHFETIAEAAAHLKKDVKWVRLQIKEGKIQTFGAEPSLTPLLPNTVL